MNKKSTNTIKEPNNKIIIRNYTDLSDLIVLELVAQVVTKGKVSVTSKGEQYCFHTTFNNIIGVSVVKSGKDTNTFYVYKERELRNEREDN